MRLANLGGTLIAIVFFNLYNNLVFRNKHLVINNNGDKEYICNNCIDDINENEEETKVVEIIKERMMHWNLMQNKYHEKNYDVSYSSLVERLKSITIF